MRRTMARLVFVLSTLVSACAAQHPDSTAASEAPATLPEAPPSPSAKAPSETPPPPPSGPPCEATSPRPAHVEIVITPDDGDARIVALLGAATKSVDVTIYQLSSFRVLDALKAAAARGVRVRIIQDRREARATVVADLRAAGVDVHTSSYAFRYTHQKTVVLDAQTAFVFSGNLDRQSFGSGRNYGVIDQDADDVADFLELFEADWAERSPELACTRLVVAPVNARERVLALVAGATSTLEIEAMYITDDEVEAAVADAHRRGVTVRVLFNDPSHDIGDTTESATRLAAVGVSVRRSGPLFIHAKLIVADGTRAFVGSENFSTSSLDRNREAGVVVTSADADVGRILATFTSDWAASFEF